MAISYRNGVSIGEIILYIPALAVAILLSIRHGFGRSAGWYFLIILSLARIIGPSMELATISQPTNTSLYVGSAILQNVGFSPLLLASFGLLGRALASINRSYHTFVKATMIKTVGIIIIVGLILGIVGGVQAGNAFSSSGTYHPGTLNKVGAVLMIVAFIALVLFTILTSFSISHAEAGEKRLLLVVAASLPFLLARLIYLILYTFTQNQMYNVLEGSVTVLLCMALIEEYLVLIAYEAVGLTLRVVPKLPTGSQQNPNTHRSDNHAGPRNRSSRGAGSTALRIAKMTIIGRIIMAFVPERSDRDAEMQRGSAAK